MSERTGMEHGEVCYLQIPAADSDRSAAFYAQVFGWSVESGEVGFTAPGIIGQFFGDKPAAAGEGVLIWISVDDIRAALARAAAAGGESLEEPYADGPTRLLATVRDPGGNTIGIVEHGVS